MCEKMWRFYNAKAINTSCFKKQSEQFKVEHRNCLNASLDIARLLLYFGLSFQGHDESETFIRKVMFLLSWSQKEWKYW